MSRKFPGICGIFLFDNAPSHKKYPPDGLNPSNMNVYPGGKQAIMRDTVWNDQIPKMSLPDGTAKKMKMVLQERGVNVVGMSQKLNEYSDFSEQPTIVE